MMMATWRGTLAGWATRCPGAFAKSRFSTGSSS
jgi:hypothetical protein